MWAYSTHIYLWMIGVELLQHIQRSSESVFTLCEVAQFTVDLAQLPADPNKTSATTCNNNKVSKLC